MDRIEPERRDRAEPDERDLRSPSESHVVEYESVPSREVARELDNDLADESVGGMAGTLAGAAIGSLGGPVGAVVGAIAGAIGGWWMGSEAAHTAANVTADDESAFREHYGSYADRPKLLSYDDIHAAYLVGHLSGRSPQYRGKTFAQVEPELERGWEAMRNERPSDWPKVREYARFAFERARTA